MNNGFSWYYHHKTKQLFQFFFHFLQHFPLIYRQRYTIFLFRVSVCCRHVLTQLLKFETSTKLAAATTSTWIFVAGCLFCIFGRDMCLGRLMSCTTSRKFLKGQVWQTSSIDNRSRWERRNIKKRYFGAFKVMTGKGRTGGWNKKVRRIQINFSQNIKISAKAGDETWFWEKLIYILSFAWICERRKTGKISIVFYLLVARAHGSNVFLCSGLNCFWEKPKIHPYHCVIFTVVFILTPQEWAVNDKKPTDVPNVYFTKCVRNGTDTKTSVGKKRTAHEV